MKYKFLPHTADVKFKAFGKTLNQAFENAALAFSETIAKGDKIKNTKTKEIEVQGQDKENLFYNFLEELIYLFDAENFVTKNAKVSIKENKLKAKLQGDDAKNYKNLDHVKAMTYAEMKIKKTTHGWEVQAVLDV